MLALCEPLKKSQWPRAWADVEAFKDVVRATKVEVYGFEEALLCISSSLPELDDQDQEALSAYSYPEVDDKTKAEMMVDDANLRRMKRHLRDLLASLNAGASFPQPLVKLLRKDQAPPCPCCGNIPVEGYRPRPHLDYDSEGDDVVPIDPYDSSEDRVYDPDSNCWRSTAGGPVLISDGCGGVEEAFF
ncbi:hypothetical protein IAT38_007315 [Cryptococcus sp. DSM 104549]